MRVPVLYGDQDRQVSVIISQNSESIAPTLPKIAVYISGIELDVNRLSDSTFVGKVHIRERAVDPNTMEYLNQEGESYTVERLMPTPFRLTLKVDIWTANLDQKLQLFEQISVLFNPSLEIQTTDNYVDWGSLTVVDLEDVAFSSRTVPVGANDAIDILTFTLGTPIYISPPAKVKRLGVVTKIISNVFSSKTDPYGDYVQGLGVDPQATEVGVGDPIFKLITTVGDYDVEINQTFGKLISQANTYANWTELFDQLKSVIQNDLSRIYLEQPNGTFIVGYISLHDIEDQILEIRWDEDSFPSNEQIPSPSNRTNLGSFDAIINPNTFNPLTEYNGHQNIPKGLRLLTLENIGGGVRESIVADTDTRHVTTNIIASLVDDHRVYVNGNLVKSTHIRIHDGSDSLKYQIQLDRVASAGSLIEYVLNLNETGSTAWKNLDGSDFVAEENDIIEWTGDKWVSVFKARNFKDAYIYLTNTYSKTQYVWNGINWSKSFERIYKKGEWRIEL